MINKLFKIIHNKYSTLFSFIFSLRYLFLIFFSFIILFLSIPNFIDYGKRLETIKNYLLKNYNLKINDYEKIKFRSLPMPNLEFKNVNINFTNTPGVINVTKFKIYPKLFSIYNFKNFQIKKIIFEDSEALLEVSNLKNITQQLFNQQKKLFLKNLDLKIKHNNKPLITIENIKFANFGYSKNLITGKVFKKNFKIETKNDHKNINLKLLNSGISAKINFDDKKNINGKTGTFKSKILNSNLKFNFDYNDERIKIYKSFFRSRNISFYNNSEIILKPFLEIKTRFTIEDINSNIFESINIDKFFKSKNIIKKFNLKADIKFKPQKFIKKDLIDKFNLKLDFAYGRINFVKESLFSEGFSNCSGNINFLDEFPLLFFNCKISSNNQQQILKKFSIRSKKKDLPFNLTVKGNLNLLNNKINFKDVKLNENYDASKEDLQFFKMNFENLLLDESFLGIFNKEKINKFILELY